MFWQKPIQVNKNWYAELELALPEASSDTLKAILEHTTKLLDHIYAANEAISQKARWGIGVIVAVVVVILRQEVSPVAASSSAINFGSYLPVLVGLGIAFIDFVIISLAYKNHHSGMEPQRNFHGATITYSKDIAEQNKSEAPPSSIDFAYIVLAAVEDYQFRINQVRKVNRRLSVAFNVGALSMIFSFCYWTGQILSKYLA